MHACTQARINASTHTCKYACTYVRMHGCLRALVTSYSNPTNTPQRRRQYTAKHMLDGGVGSSTPMAEHHHRGACVHPWEPLHTQHGRGPQRVQRPVWALLNSTPLLLLHPLHEGGTLCGPTQAPGGGLHRLPQLDGPHEGGGHHPCQGHQHHRHERAHTDTHPATAGAAT